MVPLRRVSKDAPSQKAVAESVKRAVAAINGRLGGRTLTNRCVSSESLKLNPYGYSRERLLLLLALVLGALNKFLCRPGVTVPGALQLRRLLVTALILLVVVLPVVVPVAQRHGLN